MPTYSSIMDALKGVVAGETAEEDRAEAAFMLTFVGHDYSGIEVLSQFKKRGFDVTITDGVVEMRLSKGEEQK